MAHPVATLHPHPAPQGRPGLWRRIARAMAVARERRALSRLDEHLLRDVGLTRDAARREANRDAWDVPERWRF